MGDRVYVVSQQLIANNIELISAKSWEGYQQEGRGILLIDSGTFDGLDAAPNPLTYISDKQIQETVAGWPAERVTGLVKQYDPENEMIVVVKWRGEVGGYRLKPPIAPPVAYEKLKNILSDQGHQATLALYD